MIKRVSSSDSVQLEAEFTVGTGRNVILLHGLSSVRRLVLMGSKKLERDGLNLISFDARGHGQSSCPLEAGKFGYEDLAEDAFAVVDSSQRAGEPFVAVGVSMGAHTALKMALNRPERVAGLVLITPAFDPDVTNQDFSNWDRLADGLDTNGVDGFIDAYDFGAIDARWRDLAVTATRQRMERHNQLECVAQALRQVPRSRPFESWNDLSALNMPTSVIASRDGADPAHPLAVALKVADSIPNATVELESEGESPLAWRGAAISEVVTKVVGRI
jgi:pimeloyl-ACP methyl ester carboxylesterase